MFKNQIKTFLLLFVLTLLLLGLGQLIGGRNGLIIGLVFAMLINFGSYWFSDKIVLAMYHAKPALKQQYPGLHADIEEICKKAQIPKPKVYILPTTISNAFATGRSPRHAAVAVTQGILKNLSRQELKGVLSHEISHVKNRDILIATIAATIAGIISYAASMARFTAIYGSNDREKGNNIFGLLLATIIAPIAALLVQLAISRTREYIADESGAKLLKDGKPLASALLKLESEAKSKPIRGDAAHNATASLFIVNPFSAGAFLKMFSTHPPIQERVARLRGLKL